jgi:hypothetical protein
MATSEYVIDEQSDYPRDGEIWTKLFELSYLAPRKPDLDLLVPPLPRRQRRQIRVRCTAPWHSPFLSSASPRAAYRLASRSPLASAPAKFDWYHYQVPSIGT